MLRSLTLDEPEGEGDVEAALLSALCLADSFLAMVQLDMASATSVTKAALRVLVVGSRPEVLTAALELLGSLIDGEQDIAPAPEQAHSEGRGPSLVLGEVRAFAGTAVAAAAVEKLVMLLDSATPLEETVIGVVLVILQHAPWATHVEPHRELASAAARGLLDSGAEMPAAVSPTFLRQLHVVPALPQVVAREREQRSSPSRSRSPLPED